jgi:hypothetical protein
MTIPDWIPPWLKEGVAPFLAIVTVLGGFIMIYVKPDSKTEVIVLMTMVLQYYFGSSKSSQAKDDTIKAAMEKTE